MRPVRVFKTRAFGRCARKERIRDAVLCEAIDRAERGMVDADLGGRIIKQRVARPGQGRSGGYRTLIAYRQRYLAVFILGFAKNDQCNTDDADLNDLRKAAHAFMRLSDDGIDEAIAEQKLAEMDCEKVSK